MNECLPLWRSDCNSVGEWLLFASEWRIAWNSRGEWKFKHFASSKVSVTFLLLNYLRLATSSYQSIDLSAERWKWKNNEGDECRVKNINVQNLIICCGEEKKQKKTVGCFLKQKEAVNIFSFSAYFNYQINHNYVRRSACERERGENCESKWKTIDLL